METLAVAILGLNATLIGSLIWIIKALFTKVFGNDKDPGILTRFNSTLQSMNEDIRENTIAIRELQRIFKDERIGMARRIASGPHQADV